MKTAEGLVVTIVAGSTGADPAIHPRPRAQWIDVLAAGVNGTDVEIHVGKRERPPVEEGTPIVLVCAGLVRCRVAAKKLANGVYGYSIVLAGADIVAAKGIGVVRDVLAVKWESAFGSAPPRPITFAGFRDVWWGPGDEQPFTGWPHAGLPDEMAEVAKSLVRSWPKPGAPAAPNPEAAAPSGHPKAKPAAAKAPAAAPSAAPAPPPVAPPPAAPSPAPVAASTGQRSLF